ncbi:MAG: DEAD/DEAH box helicase [Gammaproteobacteria bacterium]|nr:DEAD/DEAH box helicase [Gammaproteobacteria bacterium]
MITYRASAEIWIADLPYSAKDELKAAGWTYHGLPSDCRRRDCRACSAQIHKRWWTDSAPAVRQMNSCLLDSLAARAMRGHAETVEASATGDCADIDIPAPPGLEYLPFQKAAVAYIRDAPRPKRVMLGDEPGLGKTVEAIGWLNFQEASTALVVCPANLRINWQRELERWLVLPRQIYLVDSNKEPPPDAEIVIVNYDRLARGRVHESLMGWWWEVLICDEAHSLKTPDAKRTVAVLGHTGNKKKKLPPRYGLIHRCKTFLPLTGTAMLNRPIEIWTLAHALDPLGFQDKHAFAKRFCGGKQKRIGWDREKRAPKMAWDYSGASNLAELQDRLRGRCMVRRMKRDVLHELPPKRYEILVLDPRGSHGAIARQLAAWRARPGAARMEAAERAAQGKDRARYEAAVAELEAELEVAFDELSAERQRVAMAKTPHVVDHVKGLLDAHAIPKLVVFAHHHAVIDALAEAFAGQAVTLDGRTEPDARQSAVDRFQAPDGPRLFIGGIRAAGEGITLTASSHVVFAELDWTPARNEQAADRCHRIGQRNMVLIQQLVFDQSLDALIAKTLVSKSKIAEQVLDVT